jgi:ribosomal protein S18 acetylase RimI-like enzyme
VIVYITVYVKDQPPYWQVKKVGEISGLIVRRDYRRRGVARELLGKAAEFFKSQCVKYYTVYTAVENQAGVDFYAACGLTPLYTTMIGRTP